MVGLLADRMGPSRRDVLRKGLVLSSLPLVLATARVLWEELILGILGLPKPSMHDEGVWLVVVGLSSLLTPFWLVVASLSLLLVLKRGERALLASLWMILTAFQIYLLV